MAEHGCQSFDQHIKLVLLYAELKSVTATQRRFRAIFHMHWAPSRNTILQLHTKFEEEGFLLECKRPQTAHVRSPENIAALRVAIQRSPNKSTRQTAMKMGISRRSV